MKKIALLGVALICAAFVRGDGLNIAVMDMEKILRLHPNTASDEKLLKETAKDFEEQRAKLKSAAETAMEEFEAAARASQSKALSDKARETKQTEALALRDKALAAQQAFEEGMRSMQKQLNDQELRMIRRTSDEIKKAVTAYSAEKGIDLVLQLPGKRIGVAAPVIYAKDSIDITAQIMKLIGIEETAEETAEAAEK